MDSFATEMGCLPREIKARRAGPPRAGERVDRWAGVYMYTASDEYSRHRPLATIDLSIFLRAW